MRNKKKNEKRKNEKKFQRIKPNFLNNKELRGITPDFDNIFVDDIFYSFWFHSIHLRDSRAFLTIER